MSDWVIILIAITAASVPTVTAIVVLQTVRQVHTQINSRMDQLLLLTQTASHAEGVEEERLREKRHHDLA